MYVFGSGVLLGQRTDVANSTGINFGLIQEVSTDMSFDLKELYGQYQFPVAIGRGKAKFSAKAKMGRISGIAMASLMFGQPLAAGQLLTSFGEAHPVPSMMPFTVTVTNSASFVDDYGVVYAATGLPLTRVASAPAQGQYAVNTMTGVYTFAAADTAAALLFNYTYTVNTASTQELTIANQLMGNAPTFQCQLYSTFQGVPFNVKLFSCVGGKWSMATKLDDFMIPEMDFSVQANAAGNVCEISFGEIS